MDLEPVPKSTLQIVYAADAVLTEQLGSVFGWPLIRETESHLSRECEHSRATRRL